MNKKYFKSCLPSLVIKKMQIKISIKIYYTWVRMANIKKINKNKKDNRCWWGCGKGDSSVTVGRNKNCTVENLQKTKINISYDSFIPLLGICSKDSTSYSTDVFSVMSIVVLFPTARNYKDSKCTSADKWKMKL